MLGTSEEGIPCGEEGITGGGGHLHRQGLLSVSCPNLGERDKRRLAAPDPSVGGRMVTSGSRYACVLLARPRLFGSWVCLGVGESVLFVWFLGQAQGT